MAATDCIAVNQIAICDTSSVGGVHLCYSSAVAPAISAAQLTALVIQDATLEDVAKPVFLDMTVDSAKRDQKVFN